MLKYLRLITSYIFKRKTAFILFVTAVIPSLIVGIFMTPFSEVDLLINPQSYVGASFWGIYWKVSGYGYGSWLFSFLSLILLVMMLTLLVATVDRHMRIGDLRLRNPLTRINENIWVVLPVFVAFILFKEVFDIALSLVCYLCLPLNESVYAPVLGIFFVIFYFIFSVIIAFFVNWVPHSFNTGLTAPKSLASSLKLASGHLFNLALTIFVGIIVTVVVMTLGIMAGGITKVLLSAISYFALSIYFVVMMYVVYYDTTGLEREDINTVDIWDKKHGI